MIFYCVIFCCQKGSFPAEIRPFKQFPTGHFQLTCTIKSYAIWHTHIYVCWRGGEGERKKRMQETWYNFKQGIRNFAEQNFFIGWWEAEDWLWPFDVYVSCFDKQHGAAIFKKNVDTNSEY